MGVKPETAQLYLRLAVKPEIEAGLSGSYGVRLVWCVFIREDKQQDCGQLESRRRVQQRAVA